MRKKEYEKWGLKTYRFSIKDCRRLLRSKEIAMILYIAWKTVILR